MNQDRTATEVADEAAAIEAGRAANADNEAYYAALYGPVTEEAQAEAMERTGGLDEWDHLPNDRF